MGTPQRLWMKPVAETLVSCLCCASWTISTSFYSFMGQAGVEQ